VGLTDALKGGGEVEVEVVHKSTGVPALTVFNITPCIKVVSNQGDGERDARIDPCQSAFYPDSPASPLPSYLIALDDPMASETVRPLPTFMSGYIYGIWR